MKALILAAAALVAVIGSARAESGIASQYSTRELGTRTASGRPLHDGALTAAHRTLPFGSRCVLPEWPQCGRYDYRPGAFYAR
jgi:rare lipoprotein A